MGCHRPEAARWRRPTRAPPLLSSADKLHAVKPCPDCKHPLDNAATDCPECTWEGEHRAPPAPFVPPPKPEHTGFAHAARDLARYALTEGLTGFALVLAGGGVGYAAWDGLGLALGVALGVVLFACTLVL